MPRGPKGEKRPADVIGAAVMVGRIATGDVEEERRPETLPKIPQLCFFQLRSPATSVARGLFFPLVATTIGVCPSLRPNRRQSRLAEAEAQAEVRRHQWQR